MQSVEQILERNSRVEIDKAWETSKTRRACIAVLTYITVCIFLIMIGNDRPFINGLVPVAGFLLSTLSLRSVKRFWLRKYGNK
jgi:hypothetical protein